MKIVCAEHGIFEQTPDSHLRHRGCKICGYNKSSSLLKSYNEEFINKSNSVHNNRYDYSLVSYVNAKTKVLITCLIHGEFKQTPDAHLHGSGCPKCFDKVSRKELELFSFIQENTDEEIITNKSPTFFESNHHLDIYIPNLKIAFKFNGEYWHSEDFGRGEDYHRYKFNKCKEASVKLLHVWENDWKNHIEMVKELILRTMNNEVEFDEIEKYVWK